jgi:hypothetical protein
MATYPAAIFSPTTLVDNVDYPQATHINTPNAEIVAIETELGVNPHGSAASVVARLAIALANDGDLRLTSGGTLTISGGVITGTNNLHAVDTEGAAAADMLDTINGGEDGYVLILTPANSAHVVTIGHNTGNILCVGARNISMSADGDFVVLVYSSTLSKWRAMYGGKRLDSITTKTADYTAAIADDTILVDATAAPRTITLPPATSSAGWKFNIKKVDATANAVTIDGNGAETIDGAATKSTTTQYAGWTVECDGSAWYLL